MAAIKTIPGIHLWKLTMLVMLLTTCQAPDFPKPTIESIDPPEAMPKSTIEIKGKVLSTVNEVLIGGISAKPFWVHDDDKSLMTVVVPENLKEGPANVELKSPQGSSNLYSIKVSALLPKILRIQPLSAKIGETITILGENLTTDTKVTFPKGAQADGSLVTESALTVVIPVGEISGDLILTNQIGTSKEGYHYEIIDPESSKPSVVSMVPPEPYIGEEVVITGTNFFQDETTVSLSGRKLAVPAELNIKSITEMRFKVPDWATSGVLVIANSSGEFPTNFVTLSPPSVERILPSSNAKGGPMIIYGNNLKNVEQILIGSTQVLKPGFTYVKDNMGRDVLYGRLPAVPPGAKKVKVGNLKGIVSKEFSYTVKPGDMPLPTGFTSITYPNVIVPPTLISMSNAWARNFDVPNVSGKRLVLSDGDAVGLGLIQVKYFDDFGDEHIIGYFTKDGGQIIMRIDTTLYEGRLDSQYGNGSLPYRIVLTPVYSGNQIELIYPCGLDNANPSQVKKGGKTVISGRYFYENDGFAVFFDETELFRYEEVFNEIPPYYTRLSDFKLELTLPNDASKSEHTITVRFNGTDKSNPLKVTVTN